MAPLSQATVSERKVITEILELYKNYTCLWNTACSQYGNSDVRKQALSVLLDKYKILVEDANLDTLKKKIDNMRASYRRERKKVLQNNRHKPCLWYYPLLTFLDEGTTIAVYLSDNDDDNDSGAGETFSFSTDHHEIVNPELNIDTLPEESTYTIKTDTTSETEAFGRTIGLQLSGLTPMQKTIAEKLISDVVYYGRLDKLTTKTSLINLNDDYL